MHTLVILLLILLIKNYTSVFILHFYLALSCRIHCDNWLCNLKMNINTISSLKIYELKLIYR